MPQVSLLKYDEICPFSSLRFWTTSIIFTGLNNAVRVIFGSLEDRLPLRPGSSPSMVQLVHVIALKNPDVPLRSSAARDQAPHGVMN